VDLKYNFIVGTDTSVIVNTVKQVTKALAQFDVKPYGEGNAAEKIALVLKELN
jgi:UDP-GlcNAc3NAcA epimerase